MYFTPSLQNLSISSLLSFFSEAGLLPLFLLGTSLLGDPIVFNIEINGAAILLKP